MPKKKGTPGGNPNPVQTEGFLRHIKPKAAEELGKPISLRLPVDVDEWVRSLADRGTWMRNAIVSAARDEMNKGQDE